LIATGSLEGIVNIWDGQFGKSISTIEAHSGEIITMLAWHPNQNLLASASLDGRVLIWRLE
jgi:WD40 repeat protein